MNARPGGPVFAELYARWYDTLYGPKDYAAECRLVERLVEEHAPDSGRRIIDLGAGTGEHAVRLARAGYHVVGVERSTAMLAQARAKAARTGSKAVFHEGDIRDFRLAERFDAALLMFNVIGYLTDEGDALAALRTARHHLVPGGILLIDGWWLDGVRANGFEHRSRSFDAGDTRLVREVNGSLDPATGLCTVDIGLQVSANGSPTETVHEQHMVRCFSREQIADVLRDAGFELLQLATPSDTGREPTDADFTFMCLARAVGR